MNQAAVTGEQYVGGIVGDNSGTVNACWNTGAVSGSSYAIGGIVGSNSMDSEGIGGMVKNCINTGSVIGSTHSIGGVAGSINAGTVENCYNTGDVTGTEKVGGVAGVINRSATMQNCVSLGLKVATTETTGGNTVGRVTGDNNNGTLTNNKARTDMKVYRKADTPAEVTGAADGIHGADLAVDGTVSQSDVFSQNTGWDATTIWTIPTGSLLPGSYLPTLDALAGEAAPTLPGDAPEPSGAVPNLDDSDTYDKILYANGVPLLLVAGSENADYTVVYIDKGTIGQLDDTDVIFDPDGSETTYDGTSAGNDLSRVAIYGGSLHQTVASTKISMTGGKVSSIYGGGYTRDQEVTANVTGDTNIKISGGAVRNYVHAGGRAWTNSTAQVGGNTNLEITGGTIGNEIWGGGIARNGNSSANVGGSSIVSISGNAEVKGSVYQSGSITYDEGYHDTSDDNGNSATVGAGSSITIGGGVKIGGTGKGIMINGGSPTEVKTGAASFVIGSDLAEGASVNVQLPAGYDVTSTPTIATDAVDTDLAKIKLVGDGAEGNEAYFDGNDNTIKVRETVIVPAHTHAMSVDCSATEWTQVTFDKALTSRDGQLYIDGVAVSKISSYYNLPAGNYYLAADVALDDGISIQGESEPTVNLCLNGYKLAYTGYTGQTRVLRIEAGTLNLCDCDSSQSSHTITSKVTYEDVAVSGGVITGASEEGIVLFGGTLHLYGGTIAGNGRSDAMCGGVKNAGGTFFMHGGSILYNRGDYGSVFSMSSLTISGGVISHNRANNESGGGVMFVSAQSGSSLTLSGAPVISDNVAGTGQIASNLSLGTGAFITVGNRFAPATPIGITMRETPAKNSPVSITGTNSKDYSGCFKSDKDAYVIQNGENNVVQLALPRSTDAKQITAFTIAGQVGNTVINQQEHTVQVTMPTGTDVTSLTPTITVSDKAGVSPASGTAQNFTTPVTYTVTAENGTTQNYTVTVTVQPPGGTAPAITTQTLPGGTVGTAYSHTLTADGTTPITWSVSNGSLPDGLNLDTGTGIISGTPTTAGTGAFTVKAENSKGNDTKGFSIPIAEPAPTVTGVTVTPAAPSVQKGTTQQFHVTVTGMNNPAQTVTWSIDGSHTSGTAISIDGRLTVASDEMADTLTVKAVSTVDTSKSGTATVTVTETPPAPVVTHTITASANDGGTISPSGAVNVNEGESRTFTITPDSGHRISKVTVDGAYQGSVTTYTFENVTADHSISVIFDRINGGGSSPGGSSSSGGSSSTAPSTTTTTTAGENGSSTSTTQTTSKDSSGKTTTVTTQVTKDAAGNTAGSATTVTTDNITTSADQGSAVVMVKPDGAAINSAALAAGATAASPMDILVAVPQDTVRSELQKADVSAVRMEVIIPKSVENNPAVGTVGVTVEKETVDAARQTGKTVTVTVGDDTMAVKAVWSLDGQSMRNAAGQSTDLNLGIHTAPVQSSDPIAEPVKPTVTAVGQENGLVISLTADGTLLSSAKLTVPATNQTAITACSTVALYRFDQTTGALRAVSEGIYPVDANGNVTIDIPAGKRMGVKETYVLLPVQGTVGVGTVGTGNGTTHTVRKGDTLNQISKQYGCKVEDLLALNPGVDIYNLQVGSNLRVR